MSKQIAEFPDAGAVGPEDYYLVQQGTVDTPLTRITHEDMTFPLVRKDTLGKASGTATLDANARLTASQVPTGLTAGLTVKGEWNASTNTPTLVNGTGTDGDLYIITTAGTTTLDGTSAWFNRDQVFFADGAWHRSPAIADPLTLPEATIDELTSTIVNAGTVLADTSTTTVANMSTASVGGNTTTTGDARWSLFGAVETDATGTPISWVEANGTRNFGRVKAADLIATKGTLGTAIMTDATATVMNAITLSVDGNTSSAGDARWGLFGALETDSTGAPIGFTSTDGVRVFKSARIGTLVLNSEPTASDHAVTKKYVDEASGGTSGAYTGIELQARDAQALAQSMAVRDQTNATIATPCWKYSHVIHYGQSFALGFGSAGVISTTAGPDGTFSFGSRPANTVATDVFTQAGSAAFLDMTISAGSEVPALGMANMLRRSQLFAYNLVNDASRQIVVNAAGKGGTSLEGLSKGATPTEYYGQLTDLIDKSVTAAGSDTYGVAAICLLQGEENYADAGADNTEAGYKATLEAFATDFATDSKTATTQTYSPGLFLCQTSSVWDTAAGDITAIGNAQLSASQDNANIYLIGPYYAYPDDGTNHLTSDGYRWLGEQFGKVINKVLVQGEGWLPCHITAAWFRGDKVLLEYHVPEPPLQIQQAYVEETLTSFTNYGFRLGDDAGAISISSVDVKKSTIVITMARETSTAANPWVQYAGRATYNGCGNICDSDPTISYATDSTSGDPYPLWNWAVAQRLTIVEDV